MEVEQEIGVGRNDLWGFKDRTDVGLGSLTDIWRVQVDVRFTPRADVRVTHWHVRFGPIADSCSKANTTHGCNDLLDQLVGAAAE